jgi:hypothetical protein
MPYTYGTVFAESESRQKPLLRQAISGVHPPPETAPARLLLFFHNILKGSLALCIQVRQTLSERFVTLTGRWIG